LRGGDGGIHKTTGKRGGLGADCTHRLSGHGLKSGFEAV
jgi:hypothetical protein